jgi:hypothetical protein
VKSYGYAMPREAGAGALVAAVYPAEVAAAHRTRCTERGGVRVDAHLVTTRHQVLQF